MKDENSLFRIMAVILITVIEEIKIIISQGNRLSPVFLKEEMTVTRDQEITIMAKEETAVTEEDKTF